MLRCFLLLSLFLTGCDWFKGPSNEHDVYTAEFELVEAEPNLNPCDGVRVIPYRVKKCFRNGFETSHSNCAGLIKLPKEFKSMAGDLEEDILNYKDEVIGTKTYTCSEGEEKATAKRDVNCSDSRYIKQIQDGIPDCNPYLINLNPLVSSEMRIQQTDVNSQNIISSYNFEVPGILKNRLYDYSTNLFYTINLFGTSLELDTNWNQKPFKTFSANCIVFIDNTYYCSSNPYYYSLNLRRSFFDGAEEYFRLGGKTECVKKSNKYFCIKDNHLIEEIPELETADQVYILYQNICFTKNHELFCTGAFRTPYNGVSTINGAENINFEKIDENSSYIKIIDSSINTGIRVLKNDNKVYGIGFLYQGEDTIYYPNLTLMNNWPLLKDFNGTIGIGLDNKTYRNSINLNIQAEEMYIFK